MVLVFPYNYRNEMKMMVLQLSYCSGQVKEAQLPKEMEAATNVWKEIADNLLMGKNQPAENLGDGHLLRVSMIEVSDLDPNDPGSLSLSVYRTCGDIHPKQPEPKLYVTGAVA